MLGNLGNTYLGYTCCTVFVHETLREREREPLFAHFTFFILGGREGEVVKNRVTGGGEWSIRLLIIGNMVYLYHDTYIYWFYFSNVFFFFKIHSGARNTTKERVQGRSEAGGSGSEESSPHLPCHHWCSQWRADPRHVWRLARSFWLLVPLRLQGYLPHQLVWEKWPPPPESGIKRFKTISLNCLLLIETILIWKLSFSFLFFFFLKTIIYNF